MLLMCGSLLLLLLLLMVLVLLMLVLMQLSLTLLVELLLSLMMLLLQILLMLKLLLLFIPSTHPASARHERPTARLARFSALCPSARNVCGFQALALHLSQQVGKFRVLVVFGRESHDGRRRRRGRREGRRKH